MAEIAFSVSPQTKSCFDRNESNGTYDTGAEGFGPLIFNIHNKAKTWVDVVVDIQYPFDRRRTVFNTGHMGPNTDDQRSVSDLGECALHITRWAPGIFEIPGSGGGEIEFVVPKTGSNGKVNITVVTP